VSVLTLGQTAGILGRKGFTASTGAQITQAVRVFQDAYRLGNIALKVDGIVGPLTSTALLESDRRLREGHADAATHFSFDEFTCTCRGTHPGCRGILVAGALIDGLSILRTVHYPDGLHVISAYRCPAKNAAVEGAQSSMHLYGAAADIAPRVSTAAVRKLGVFSGIGTNQRSGKVSHVDARGVARATAPRPPNATGATLRIPTLWNYPR